MSESTGVGLGKSELALLPHEIGKTTTLVKQ